MAQQILEHEATQQQHENAASRAARGAKGGPSPDTLDKDRRWVIKALLLGYLGTNFLMFLRFFFPRALYEPNTIVNIGYPTDFQLGQPAVSQLESHLGNQGTRPHLRHLRPLHTPRLHAGLAAAAEHVPLPVPWQ